MMINRTRKRKTNDYAEGRSLSLINNRHQQMRSSESSAHATNRNCKLPDPSIDNVFRLQTTIDLQYDDQDIATTQFYREAVCSLCEKTVSLALNVPLAGIQSRTRSSSDIALARQIAMYLCRTMFNVLLTEIGLHFGRDRTTVAHACASIEDRRDQLSFDVLICQLEALICEARHAMSICLEHQQFADGPVCDDQEKLRLGYAAPLRLTREVL